jgi:hypothetical protein
MLTVAMELPGSWGQPAQIGLDRYFLCVLGFAGF